MNQIYELNRFTRISRLIATYFSSKVMSLDSTIQVLESFLTGRMAHKTFEDVILKFPVNKINTKLKNIPYSFWHLLEHIRIAQKDILDYIEIPNYVSPKWPDDHWPPKDAMATLEQWDKTVSDIRSLYKRSKAILKNKNLEQLSKKLDHVETDHSILCEIISIIDHNSYHMGQFITMRMILGIPSKLENTPI